MRRRLVALAAAISLLLSVGTLVAWASNLRRGILLHDGGGNVLTYVLAWYDGMTGILWTHSDLPFEGEFALPDWLIVLATAVLPVVWVVRRATSRARQGACASCGYDLTGNTSGVCPECGTPTAPQNAHAKP